MFTIAWVSDGSTSKYHTGNVSNTPTNSWNESLPLQSPDSLESKKSVWIVRGRRENTQPFLHPLGGIIIVTSIVPYILMCRDWWMTMGYHSFLWLGKKGLGIFFPWKNHVHLIEMSHLLFKWLVQGIWSRFNQHEVTLCIFAFVKVCTFRGNFAAKDIPHPYHVLSHWVGRMRYCTYHSWIISWSHLILK